MEEIRPGERAVGYKSVTYNEPFLQAIFRRSRLCGSPDCGSPGQVGAVAILSEEENKGKVAYFGGINSAKFRRKVVPGDRLKLECQIIKRKGPVGIGSATASVDGKVAVSAELTFMIG